MGLSPSPSLRFCKCEFPLRSAATLCSAETKRGHSAQAIVAFRFDTSAEQAYVPYYPTFEVYSNVSSFTCLNLDEVFSNNNTVSDDSITDRTSTFLTLNGVLYTRPEDNNGGNSSGENWIPSRSYDRWAIGQGESPSFQNNSSETDAQDDTGVKGELAIYIYGEEDCNTAHYPPSVYTCENEVAGTDGAAFGARSVALEPNDLDGPGCIWGSRNETTESGAALSVGLREREWMVWGVVAAAVAMAAAMS